MENMKNQVVHHILIISVLLILSACEPQNTRSNWAYEEYGRMIEPTTTSKEIARSYDIETPEEFADNDGDGWPNDFDLCPDEPAQLGLAGCKPLLINNNELEFTLLYQLPVDPSGRINVFGDRFLVLTNYESGELQIYDLADGTALRNFPISDMLNDSPILLSQGIILKNYDQQRWRLLDYSGNEIYAANEELEIISENHNLLVSRTDNTIFLRKLDNIKSVSNSIPGRYVSFSPDGMLSITNSDACTITLLDINNFTKNESYLFSPGNTICYQSTQFSNDGQYAFFVEDGLTHLISLQHPDEHFTYSGIPMGQTAHSLIVQDDNVLYQQEIPQGEKFQLLVSTNSIIQKVIVRENINTAAILTRNMEINQSGITLIDLENHEIQGTLDAESIQFMDNWFFVWSFGDENISFYELVNNQRIAEFETQPISALQTAVDNNIFLISGQDHQLYIYGPEIK